MTISKNDIASLYIPKSMRTLPLLYHKSVRFNNCPPISYSAVDDTSSANNKVLTWYNLRSTPLTIITMMMSTPPVVGQEVGMGL
jgi:hypothetical protein